MTQTTAIRSRARSCTRLQIHDLMRAEDIAPSSVRNYHHTGRGQARSRAAAEARFS